MSESSLYTLRSDMEEKVKDLPGADIMALLLDSREVRDIPAMQVRPVASTQVQTCDVSASVILWSGKCFRIDVTELDPEE